MATNELPIIQKTYNLIKWYVPILNRLPVSFKFNLGERITTRLYDLLEDLLIAQYQANKIQKLEELNQSLVVLRYQARLLLDFELINLKRYEHIITKLDSIGTDLGGWLKQQKQKPRSHHHETLR
ncbi:MAG: diversity-generating retroelement protein Avd [Prochlorotrichaceae cyanobacterium]|jgi:hypothetical protein